MGETGARLSLSASVSVQAVELPHAPTPRQPLHVVAVPAVPTQGRRAPRPGAAAETRARPRPRGTAPPG